MRKSLHMSPQVRANPGSVRGVRCVLDKLQRALAPALGRLRQARAPELPAAAAAYSRSLLGFSRRLLQARACSGGAVRLMQWQPRSSVPARASATSPHASCGKAGPKKCSGDDKGADEHGSLVEKG